MTLLIPLGLLGLLSVVALIVIYIIKPNYQHKEVTSTYVWKLSLRYRKKRLPSGKLRNIFLIVCQVLALVAGALIMAWPVIGGEETAFDTEVIAIIDASASMRAEANGETRFERAVREVQKLADETVARDGYVSVILSDGNDGFLVRRAGLAGKSELDAKLSSLVEKNNLACSYGSGNLDDSIALCEEILKSNPTASVYLYTDTDYAYVPEGISLVNVANDSEWNVGILNAYTEFEEGYYTFFVELGCYGGVSRTVNLNVSVNDADGNDANGKQNAKREVVRYSADVTLKDNSATTVIFRNYKITEADYESNAENTVIVSVGDDSNRQCDATRVFAYGNVNITVDEKDSLDSDNGFSIYGGRKQELKIQYATSNRKLFFTSLFAVLRKNYANYWDIVVDEVIAVDETASGSQSGYDLYVYDGIFPMQMPTDGVVFIFNPRTLPVGFIGEEISYSREVDLLQDNNHAILKNTDASKIFVTKCRKLSQYDTSVWQSLWSAEGNPVLLLQDGEHEKVILALLDTEYSNIVIRNDFAYLFQNVFETFMPSTVKGHSFDVGQDIAVNARGNKLTMVYGPDSSEIAELPSTIRLDKPGVYRFEPESYFVGKKLAYDEIFVKVPAAESNIFAEGLALKAIYRDKNDNAQEHFDLLVCLAAAMLALLFTEWFLQTQEAI